MSEPIGLRTDDELLSALLDGALPEPDTQRLRARLAREPALAARLAALERVDVIVRDAYAGVADEPLPPAVLALLAEPVPDGAADRDNIVPIGRRRGDAWRTALPVTLAASLTLAIGLSLGWVAGSQQADSEDWIAAGGLIGMGNSLHEALEGVPSGIAHDLGGGATATPQLTFRTADGGYCRELELASTQGVARAVACRRDAAWRVAVAEFAPAGNSGVYRPATGGDSAVEAAVDALIDGAPLASAAEQAAIASGWER